MRGNEARDSWVFSKILLRPLDVDAIACFGCVCVEDGRLMSSRYCGDVGDDGVHKGV